MTGQRIAITGSSGVIGGALSSCLRRRGDTVIRIVRRPAVTPGEVTLPEARSSNSRLVETLATVDAVVNLAGAGVGDHRWSRAYKDAIRESRIETTSRLADALAEVPQRIRLVSASAIGFYGDRGDEVLDETSAPGEDFLARVCIEWEAAAMRAAKRHDVALARTGLVMTGEAGAFAPLLTTTRLGAGGPLGSGRQWWSWITLRDEVRALVFLLDHPDVVGPVNLVAPRASRQADLAQALARSLRRPAALRVPKGALRFVLGEMADQVTASTRVRPHVLEAAGFDWQDENQDQALDRLVASAL
ncbi:TIGR01777 family oxidoreductase [Dermacoccus nishinomiyaensis]|uniref:TIGR01777 family oxidoreductase n=1 Tax=Dermacoccus TaxID=57495 RepID=UPI0001E644D9|nr:MULTISPECIES: TIGR01777 family oxidoreductase [Dermacoccus]EFP57211.1 TIGR01777 family protein [Dermacoccus sp. Ellin185]MCT1605361.1 TIGR01777 family oxidoreductase [Dermacoccus nishinomiyaensis]QQY25859.1 TIGR01777 family oxidoreductase [Dermacoccus nishinomiyaensis]TCJ91417.1 hypothetical protein EDC82_1163 [Dermacoccus sp. SAI-028]STD16119.1 Epimerase family protein SA0724 [Dermacoccus nishinomiyaensis]